MAQAMPAASGPGAQQQQSAKPLPTEIKKLFKDLKAVQIDGCVLLKLFKYCGESATSVSGRLLGLQNREILEVTNCFPHHNNSFKNEMNKQILALMEDVRQDNFLVGWYVSSINGNYLTAETIENQYSLQATFSNAVCVVYDPTFSKSGRLVLRAFRLTDKFMGFYKAESLTGLGPTAIGKHGIHSGNILEELPLQVHCTHLTHSFLFEIQKDGALQCDFDRLHHGHSQALLNNLKQLSNQVEMYAMDTNAFRQYYNRANRVKWGRENYANDIIAENRKLKSRGLRTRQMPDLEKLFPSVPEQSRIESVLLNSQMNEFTKEVDTSTMQGLAKLWLTQGLHQNEPMEGQ